MFCLVVRFFSMIQIEGTLVFRIRMQLKYRGDLLYNQNTKTSLDEWILVEMKHRLLGTRRSLTSMLKFPLVKGL